MISSLLKRTAVKRTVFFVFSDIFFIALSVWLAFFLRFDGNIPGQYLPFIPRIVALAIFFVVPIFYIRKMYLFSWSYVSSSELISLFLSATVAFILLATAIFISNYFHYFLNFPRSIIFISYVLVFVFCGSARLAKRVYLQFVGRSDSVGKERTLIVGAGDAGEQIVRHIQSSRSDRYFPVGFVDDNSIKQGVKIHGVLVLGKLRDIPVIVKKHTITQLIVALPSANHKIIKEAVELGRKAGLYKIKIAPKLHEIIRGEVALKNLKDVDVEDLLGRDSVTLDKKQIEQYIKDKIVLVTGAAGSIGSELSSQIAKFHPSLLLLIDQDETGIFSISKELREKFPQVNLLPYIKDVTDEASMKSIFKEHQPAIVFHAAAYKHVPLMEKDSDEAVKNNVFGTWNVVKASLEFGVEKFIFISTDKAINPTSVMGATKRIGEMICQTVGQNSKTSFISVRFGNVLNSRGSVIPIFKEHIKRGGPVEVTHPEMKRYFMLTSEACLLVMQAGVMGKGGEVFVLDMGKPVKIVDLAREMIKLSGFKPDEDIAIVFTGMRPGEKLFEEIMTADENTIATQNQKIFTAKLAQIDPDQLYKQLELLEVAYQTRNKEAIKAILRVLIPAFGSIA